MFHLKTKHFITGEEIEASEIMQLIYLASELKKTRRSNGALSYLKGKHLALLFGKPSLRTRFSFAIAIRELGGDVIESVSETRKMEEPEDQARVLGGYCDAIMIRTHDDENIMRMRTVSPIPVINGLSDLHHPCQALSDLLTLHEIFHDLKGLTLSYVGDGNNVLHSLLLLTPIMGIHLNFSCPSSCMPDEEILKRSKERAQWSGSHITFYASPLDAVKNANAVYTDVWTSMGFENKKDEKLFADFQVNETLMQKAYRDAVFMHCLPMQRGKEVSVTLPDQPCSVIFQQSENRLHMQKALLMGLLK